MFMQCSCGGRYHLGSYMYCRRKELERGRLGMMLLKLPALKGV